MFKLDCFDKRMVWSVNFNIDRDSFRSTIRKESGDAGCFLARDFSELVFHIYGEVNKISRCFFIGK